MISVNLLITFISILIFLFFSTIFYFFINKRAQKWGIARQESAGNKLKKLQQGFAAIRDIKMLNKEKFFLTLLLIQIQKKVKIPTKIIFLQVYLKFYSNWFVYCS